MDMKWCKFYFNTKTNIIYKSIQIDNEKVQTQWIIDGQPGSINEKITGLKRKLQLGLITIIEGNKVW